MVNKNSGLSGLRILITGGLGFIGSNLAKRCVEDGAQVTIYDNLDKNSGGNLFNINSIADAVELIRGDITNYDDLIRAVPMKNIIFHCAASTSHHFAMREPWINLDVNSRGTINVLEAVRELNPHAKVVHLGTSTQLGELRYIPADEMHPEFPLDIYSATKSFSEKLVLIYAKGHQLDATVVRLSNVYGPRAAISTPDLTFNNYFIGQALQGKPISVYRPGLQKRNLVYVDDVVDALLMCATTDKIAKEVVFAVGDEHYTVLNIAKTIARIFGGTVQIVDWPIDRELIDVGDAVLTNKKIKELLGWLPKTSLDIGLNLTSEFFSDHLDKYIN